MMTRMPKAYHGPLHSKNIKRKSVDFRNGASRVSTKTQLKIGKNAVARI